VAHPTKAILTVPPRRFQFRYSLRAFFLAVLAISVTAGLWTHRSLDQRQKVRVLQGIGLDVQYDLADSNQSGTWTATRRWLGARLGRDWVSVPLAVRPASELVVVYSEDCAVLYQLPSIRVVDLHYTGADDECLSTISRMRRLESLILSNTLVTGWGLSCLDKCRSLQEVDIDDTLVTEAAAQEFRQRHPRCRLNYNRHLDLRNAENHRRRRQKADRVPTPAEAEELAFSLALIGTEDNFAKGRILAEHLGEKVPSPGDPYYPTWERYILDKPRDWHFLDAIDELGTLGLAVAIPALKRIAHDVTHCEDVRCGAIRALVQIADRRVVPVLIELLEDQVHRVADRSRCGLQVITGQMIGDKSDLPKLNTPARRKLINDWRTYWQENRDVLRPRPFEMQ
jgi:HEAT repeats